MHSDQSVMIRWVWATFIFHPIYKGQFGSLVGQLILQAGTIADMASMGSMLPGWSWNSTPSSPSLSFLQETTEPLFAADSNDGIRGHMGKTCVFFSLYFAGCAGEDSQQVRSIASVIQRPWNEPSITFTTGSSKIF